jgi:hypothetical protein
MFRDTWDKRYVSWMPRLPWMPRLLSHHSNHHITPSHHLGVSGVTTAGQRSCTSLISRAFPHLWPRGAEISFCHAMNLLLNYSIPGVQAACRRLFTLLFGPEVSPDSRPWHLYRPWEGRFDRFLSNISI